MEEKILRPEGVTRAVWYIDWCLATVIALIPCLLGAVFIPEQDGRAAALIFLVGGAFYSAFMFVWIPFYHASLYYKIRDDGVHSSGGVISKKKVTVPYTKVTNIDILRGPVERMFGVGRLKIQTAGMSGQAGSELVLRGMRELEYLRDTIYAHVRLHQSGIPLPAQAPRHGGADDVQEKILKELVEIRRLLARR